MLEYIILGFLMEKELSGYDLKQIMSESTSYFLTPALEVSILHLKIRNKRIYTLSRSYRW